MTTTTTEEQATAQIIYLGRFLTEGQFRRHLARASAGTVYGTREEAAARYAVATRADLAKGVQKFARLVRITTK